MDYGVNNGSPYGNYLQSQGNRGFNWKAASAVGGIAALPLMGGLWAGAGAPAAAAGGSQVAPAAAGGLGRLGAMLGGPAASLGVNSLMGLFGLRSQNKAADRAAQLQYSTNQQQMALYQKQLEEEERNQALDRADAKAQNDAANELKRRELTASEEDRKYVRDKDVARQAYLAPYRAIQQQALSRLMSMWGG